MNIKQLLGKEVTILVKKRKNSKKLTRMTGVLRRLVSPLTEFLAVYGDGFTHVFHESKIETGEVKFDE